MVIRRDLLGHVRKDSQVVFYICLAGGGPTGIPTGDKLLSNAKNVKVTIGGCGG